MSPSDLATAVKLGSLAVAVAAKLTSNLKVMKAMLFCCVLLSGFV